MRCPGCPPSISQPPCFSWPAKEPNGLGNRQRTICVFSNELSKQELAHLLVYENKRVAQCRAEGIPYESTLQHATKVCNVSPASPRVTTLINRSGPYSSRELDSLPAKKSQSTSLIQIECAPTAIMPHSLHLYQPALNEGQSLQRFSCSLPSSSPRREFERREFENRPLTAHTPLCHAPRHALDYESLNNLTPGSSPRRTFRSIQENKGSISPPRPVFGTGKRRAYQNPTGLHDGFAYMPGICKTSRISSACHTNPYLQISEYVAPSSSYCHFRPGLGNTYFYD